MINSAVSTQPTQAAEPTLRQDLSNPTGRPLPKVNQGSVRMFSSDLLEKFSRVHPATPAVVFGPLVLISLYLAATSGVFSWPGLVASAVAGYVLWTVSEYWLHRLFFHLKVVGPKTRRIYFVVHGVHHDYPWDTSRLVIPPGASLVLAIVFFALFRAVFGADYMYPVFAGFVGGYVIYDTTHWYIHARVPRTRFGRWLRREHMVHHFKAPGSRYGVSCPWLDHVFRTTEQKDA